ncbi:allantoate amidohydrolase [Xanthobacter autotrophicus DSM 431]|uniref:allantoate amidohydrolase n=1 Tax=Xanthobacter nonsaccharivorans TaxID=3119912 RepID=UPI00372A3DDF
MPQAAPVPALAPLDGDTITARLKELAAFTEVPGELTRLTLTPAHKRAAAQVSYWMREAGLTQVHMDATGSIVGRYPADRANAKTLLIGSHIDTVRNAGIYDGNLGVLTAIAAVEALKTSGIRLPFAIEVAAFADEEGVRFLSTLTSSKAMAGLFDPRSLEDVDAQGISRIEALRSFGAPVDRVADCRRDPQDMLGYVEVHIEQGPVLEAAGAPLGIVTGIAGASRGHVRVRGEAGHSGTLPMAMRHDALAAAAEMILAVEARGRANGDDLVATVGTLVIAGSAVNVVPGEVQFSLDVRTLNDDLRHAALADIRATVAEIAARRGVRASVDIGHEVPAAPCHGPLKERMAEVVESLGLPALRLPSGAGHDAMVFRGIMPMAMLFVRSQNGSHNPREYAAPADIGLAAEALYAFLLKTAQEV